MKGKELKKLREQNGLSQKQLAEKIGVSDGTIANYENERTKISKDRVVLINKVFSGQPVNHVPDPGKKVEDQKDLKAIIRAQEKKIASLQEELLEVYRKRFKSIG